MPTFESKFGLGDRVVVRDRTATVKWVAFGSQGPVYAVKYNEHETGVNYGEDELKPAPPEPEVWPKVRGSLVAYGEGITRGVLLAEYAERIVKLERLAWLACAPEGASDAQLDEYNELREHFRQFHGPWGEVYLESRKGES